MAKAKYQTHIEPYIDRIKMWAAKGATVREIASKLNVAESTFRKMRREHEALSSALDTSLGEADDQVETALFKRCVGYDYEEVTKWQTVGRGGELIWLEKRTVKHLPPDPSSIQFWLTNRRPQNWKRMPEAKGDEAETDQGVVMIPEVLDE